MITTVFFDLGGTLEDVSNTVEEQLSGVKLIQDLLRNLSNEYDIDPQEFAERLLDNVSSYKSWSTESCIELPPSVIWGEWFLKGFPSALGIGILLGENLSDIWEFCFYTRKLKPQTRELLKILKTLGFRMGIVSNTTSPTLPLRLLRYYGIDHYFESCLLSSTEGLRKPNTELFLRAANLMGVKPIECLFIGDQITKDVIGPAQAGFGATALLTSYLTKDDLSVFTHRLGELCELPDILNQINRI